MAIEDFGAAKKGLKVEVLVADHQNKPDVGSSIARQWFDADKVDVIVDVPTSSVVLAVNQIAREKNKALESRLPICDRPAQDDRRGPSSVELLGSRQ